MATTEENYKQFVSDAAIIEGGNSKSSKFQINLRKYPSDLGNTDLLHYVQFAINVRGKSTLVPESKRLFETVRDPRSAGLTRDQLGSSTLRGATAAAAGIGAGVATTTLLDAGAKGVNSVLTGVSSRVAKAVNITGAVSQKVT
jgi:hypothetical protein